MNGNNNNNEFHKSGELKKELSISDLIRIISRRKKTFFLTMSLFLILAIAYSFVASPVFKATVTLKKERMNDRSGPDGFKEMFLMQSMDEIDTELEIIKTRTVIEKLIVELNLLLTIQKMEFHTGELLEFDEPIPYRNIKETLDKKNLPEFYDLKISGYLPTTYKTYYINFLNTNRFYLYDEESEEMIQSQRYDAFAEFNLPGIQFSIKWPNGKPGDKVYFKINDFEEIYNRLEKNIIIARIGKTNLFTVSVRSKSPVYAQLIANSITDEFREIRLNQKRQTIHFSFEFVDNQLKEIQKKLKSAEIELSRFRSENKIMDIDESSSEIIRFLSSLESEKVKADLELADNQSKLKEMRKEQQDEGFFDQTYLTPSGSDYSMSPFSVLLRQLSDAEIKRLELLQRRKESHPDVIILDEQIDQIRNGLSQYNQNTMTSYQILINTLRKKRYNLNRLIEKYSSKIENLPAQESMLIELMRKKNVYEKMFTMLLDKREELRMAEFSKLQDIVIVDPARIPTKPVYPKKALNIIIGLISGLFIGFILIFVQEFFEEKVKDIDEIEKEYTLPILAIIPKYNKKLIENMDNADDLESRLVSLMTDQVEFRESYRLLRTRMLNISTKGKKVFLFTSSEENTGKSSIVANIAISLARGGKKILIIDGDLRKAGLSRIFGVPNKFPDIKDFLTKEGNKPILFKPFSENNSNLEISLLSGGSGNIEESSELLESEKMKYFMDFIQPEYDFILIDSPPVTKLVDTLIIGNYAKNIIFVIRPDHTLRDGAKFAMEEIRLSAIDVLGIVVNACDVHKSSHKYKYGYGYGYAN